ncbi:MAG: hypothetical protein IPQ05_21745 [Leptospiraceae bacterium]|nr:hypothetical protein [Leptospiraceae bacterium]
MSEKADPESKVGKVENLVGYVEAQFSGCIGRLFGDRRIMVRADYYG